MCTNFLLNYLILKLVAESPLEPCPPSGGKEDFDAAKLWGFLPPKTKFVGYFPRL